MPPPLDDFKPTGSGEPPLARAKDWVRYSEAATRELNTMPQWAGSCWYYLRFCDPGNGERFVGKEAERYWMGARNDEGQMTKDEGMTNAQMPNDGGSGHSEIDSSFEIRHSSFPAQPGGVDLYVGGTEHAVLHLLYARFWHKVLFDLGHLSTNEPFQRLVNQGIILGEDGRKMSKRWGNVIDPLDVIAEYGADAFRCYEMFMGPLEQMKPWSMTGVEGVSRFLARVWRLVMEENQAGEWILSPTVQETEPTRAQLKVIHATIKKVGEDIEALSFNTAIAQMMIFVNAFTTAESVPVSALRTLLVVSQSLRAASHLRALGNVGEPIPDRARSDHRTAVAGVPSRVSGRRRSGDRPPGKWQSARPRNRADRRDHARSWKRSPWPTLGCRNSSPARRSARSSS